MPDFPPLLALKGPRQEKARLNSLEPPRGREPLTFKAWRLARPMISFLLRKSCLQLTSDDDDDDDDAVGAMVVKAVAVEHRDEMADGGGQ